MVSIIGPFPKSMLSNGTETHKYFTAAYNLYEECEIDGSNEISADSSHELDQIDADYKLIYPKCSSLKYRAQGE